MSSDASDYSYADQEEYGEKKPANMVLKWIRWVLFIALLFGATVGVAWLEEPSVFDTYVAFADRG